MTDLLETQSRARRNLLRAVKRLGDARADELADLLGIHVSGVRQHLATLERDGLIEHREVRAERGRPRFVYRLSRLGEELFPRSYGSLANEVLELVEEEDAGLLDKIFSRHAERRAQRAAPRLAGKAFARRIRELATVLSEDGYEAEVTRTQGGWQITERNCSVSDVAHRFRQACTSELEFLMRSLPDTEISRVAHIVSGDRCCVWDVKPRVR